MKQIYLESKDELEKIKEEYNEYKNWGQEIDEVVTSYPCILISSYSDDIEFGDYYQFSAVTLSDFNQE